MDSERHFLLPGSAKCDRKFTTLDVLCVVAILVAFLALVIASVAVNKANNPVSSPNSFLSFPGAATSVRDRVVSLDAAGNVLSGAGLSVQTAVSPFDINDTLTHIEMDFFGKNVVIVVSSDGIMAGRYRGNDVTWKENHPLSGVGTIDGFVALSSSTFILLSGHSVYAGSVNLDSLSIFIFDAKNYTLEFPIVDPVLTRMSNNRFAVSYFCHGANSICGVVGTLQQELITIGKEAIWSQDDHTYHDVISLNSTTLVFFCPMDNIANGTYQGPLSATLAIVNLNGDIIVGKQTTLPLQDQANNFFDAVAMSDNTAVVCFPDRLLNEGLNCVAIRFESLSSLDVVSTLRPGSGGRDAMYEYLSMERIDSTHFVIGYVNNADGNILSLLVCEFVMPGVGLVESYSSIELSASRSSKNVLWLAVTADRATSTFFVVHSQLPSGGALAIGHLANPPLGYATNKGVLVAGLIEPPFAVVPGASYYCSWQGELFAGPPYSSSSRHAYVTNGRGEVLTQLVGVGVSPTQILLQR